MNKLIPQHTCQWVAAAQAGQDGCVIACCGRFAGTGSVTCNQRCEWALQRSKYMLYRPFHFPTVPAQKPHVRIEAIRSVHASFSLSCVNSKQSQSGRVVSSR